MFNDTVFAKRTFVTSFEVDGDRHVLSLTAEIHALGTQTPYFDLTYSESDSRSRRRNDSFSGGMASRKHVEPFAALPEYPLLKRALHWHLFSPQTAFMHYEANALYFWNIARGNIEMPRNTTRANMWKSFNRTIGYGLLDESQFEAPHRLPSALVLANQLRFRAGYLKAAFQHDMRALFPGLTFDANHMPSQMGESTTMPEDFEDDSLSALLARAGVTLKAVQVDSRSDGLMSGRAMTHWHIELKRKDYPTMRCFFSMGSAHHGRRPRIEEVVGNLVDDSSNADMSARDFANELGYDDLKEARKVHAAIVKNTNALRKLLGDDLFTDLTDIE